MEYTVYPLYFLNIQSHEIDLMDGWHIVKLTDDKKKYCLSEYDDAEYVDAVLMKQSVRSESRFSHPTCPEGVPYLFVGYENLNFLDFFDAFLGLNLYFDKKITFVSKVIVDIDTEKKLSEQEIIKYDISTEALEEWAGKFENEDEDIDWNVEYCKRERCLYSGNDILSEQEERKFKDFYKNLKIYLNNAKNIKGISNAIHWFNLMNVKDDGSAECLANGVRSLEALYIPEKYVPGEKPLNIVLNLKERISKIIYNSSNTTAREEIGNFIKKEIYSNYKKFDHGEEVDIKGFDFEKLRDIVRKSLLAFIRLSYDEIKNENEMLNFVRKIDISSYNIKIPILDKVRDIIDSARPFKK